jgi:hypothetical protein
MDMTTRKKTLLFISIPTVVLLVRLLTAPSCVRTEWALKGLGNRYQVVDYGNNIDTNRLAKTIVYSGFFSFDKTLDKAESKNLLSILLDSTNYNAGEWGTPNFTKSFYFIDSEGIALGKTVFDEIGQTRTWPSTELQTKLGALSEKGLKKVLQLTQQ